MYVRAVLHEPSLFAYTEYKRKMLVEYIETRHLDPLHVLTLCLLDTFHAFLLIFFSKKSTY